ncbi:MAG: hypothetical protein ACRD3W_21280, partial [Terriglobales bacterium]
MKKVVLILGVCVVQLGMTNATIARENKLAAVSEGPIPEWRQSVDHALFLERISKPKEPRGWNALVCLRRAWLEVNAVDLNAQ